MALMDRAGRNRCQGESRGRNDHRPERYGTHVAGYNTRTRPDYRSRICPAFSAYGNRMQNAGAANASLAAVGAAA